MSKDSDEDKLAATENIGVAEKNLFSLLVKVGEALRKRNETSKAANENLSKSSPFVMEKLQVPKFHGRPDDWQSFEDLFVSAVNNHPSYTDSTKIAYLKQALKGDAASIVSRFPTSNSSFADAWALVVKRYSNMREIAFGHMRKFFEMPSLQENSSNLRKLVDTLNECHRSLKNLKVPVEQWDLVFIYVALQKLDSESRREWLLTQGTDLPKLSDFLEFFQKRATALADSLIKKPHKPKTVSKSANLSNVNKIPNSVPKCEESDVSTFSSSKAKCELCSGESHAFVLCPVFKNYSVPARREFIKKCNPRRCFHCFRTKCSADQCDRGKCKICDKPHHVMLHSTPSGQSSQSPSKEQPNATTSIPRSPSVDQTLSGHCASENPRAQCVLMETALVDVVDSHGNRQQCRVFLDSGSESHFISENCVERLGLTRSKTCVNLTGIGGSDGGTARGLIRVKLCSQVNSFSIQLQALVLKKCTGAPLPRHPVSVPAKILKGLKLADVHFTTPGPVDIIIGKSIGNKLSRPGLRINPEGHPDARNTVFGWVISGVAPSCFTSSVSIQCLHSRCSVNEPCVDKILTKFWELEEPCPQNPPASKEERECEKWFQSSVTKTNNGQYSIGLPFIQPFPGLGCSRVNALRRLTSVEKSLAKYPEMKSNYHQQMQEFIENGWMEEVPKKFVDLKPHYYLPHHVVTKEESSTTKYRIVFGASAKSSNGLSLNNVLHTGPKLQTDLVQLLIRFRTHVVALSADIVKFYNCFLVHSDFTNYQRLVYQPTTEDGPKDYRMLRVTFGVASAPYLAIRCLHKLAEDTASSYPMASSVIKEQFLVHNLLSGADTVEEAQIIQNQLIDVMATGQLRLRKWTSNYPALVSSVSIENQAQSLPREIGADGTVKTIGLLWNSSLNTFSIKLTSNPFVGNTSASDNSRNQSEWQMPTSASKRQVLSGIARIFDPLGWLSPVTIRPKILLQTIWKEKLDWDSFISEDAFKKWKRYNFEIKNLVQFFVPRCIVFKDGTSVVHELHGFSDASDDALSACVYLKTFSSSGAVICNLVCAKTSVAPLKKQTTPRLELCGALLLAKLLDNVRNSLHLDISSISCWTDSTCVLGWITSDEKLETFVHNRVSKIITTLPSTRWSHVKGEDNPADCASRGVSVEQFLTHPLWLQGPAWLISMQQVTSLSTHVDPSQSDWFYDKLLEYVQRTSSFAKMRRHLAHWVRFITNCSVSPIARRRSPLTVTELDRALVVLVKCVQRSIFSKEIDVLKRKRPILGYEKSLTPFLDEEGILRVGGRLRHSFWSYDQKHPILLPKTHHFTNCVIRHIHHSNNHPGPQLPLSLVRDKFWVYNGTRVCSSIVRQCIQCHRANPKPMSQIIGQLPTSRVAPAQPFNNASVDYARPFHLNATPGRNPKTLKGYVAVFVCLAVKAIHLEYVSDLSTPAFLASFDGFISTRGLPSQILCDGGRNFLGAKSEFEEIQKFISTPQHVQRVTRFFSKKDVEFVTNPPDGPHHGGIFEAGVKSMKSHLRRVAGDRRLFIEEFWTLLKRIEGTLNSRPLTPVSADANDFSVLTPGHFLIGRSLKAAPQRNLEDLKMHQLTRWQHVQQMAQHFNRRWCSQYLQTLQKAPKWYNEQPNLGVGAMVLLHDSDSSIGPQQWTLGRISKVFPGKDGLIRVCDVTVPIKTAKVNLEKSFPTKVYRRPITRISPLPLE